jgi:hypothetical protein
LATALKSKAAMTPASEAPSNFKYFEIAAKSPAAIGRDLQS